MPWSILQDVDTESFYPVALLPTSPEGAILCFGDWAGSGPEGVVHSPYSYLSCGTETLSPEFAEEDLPDTNGFCGGQAFLSDGRLLLAGGTVDGQIPRWHPRRPLRGVSGHAGSTFPASSAGQRPRPQVPNGQ